MKTKFTKIFLLTLTLAMVIGMAVGFTASAEGETAAESVAIVSQKVEYAGTTHLYFAVKYENVANPEKIALNVSYVDSEGNAKEVTITESEEVTLQDSAGNDVVCRAFMTPGVDAKSFTHKFVAQAVTEAGTESAEKTYSVTEYCLEWLTYIATKAEPSEYELKVKDACEATLAYGTKIQAFLDCYPEANVNDYPENYVYVKGADGVKVNGADAVCVIKGSEVELTYAGTETRLGWEVADLAGTEITVTDDKFTATASCIAGPELTDATGEYFLARENGTITKGTNWDFDVITSTDKLSAKDASDGTLSITDGSLLYDDGDVSSSAMYVKFWQSYPDTYNCSIIEFDFKIDQVYGSSPIEIFIHETNKAISYTKIDGVYYLTMPDESGTAVILGAKPGSWANIRIEQYKNEGKAKVYINNEFVLDTNWAYKTTGSFRITLSANERKTASDANLWVDNVYTGHFTAEEIPYVAGDPNATPAE
ncbi:MAG: hypothetical protein IJX92_00875 [Clostridia bacterium]|nr:hypothetical protein [Clostridia bacterium]